MSHRYAQYIVCPDEVEEFENETNKERDKRRLKQKFSPKKDIWSGMHTHSTFGSGSHTHTIDAASYHAYMRMNVTS